MPASKRSSAGSKSRNGSRSKSDIRKVKVDEIYVDVEKLDARLALRAKVGDLLRCILCRPSTFSQRMWLRRSPEVSGSRRPSF